jgi:hypothetical protein
MNFNATSLVQAVHFLITFWVIKCIFLRPALKVINDIAEYKKKLGDEIQLFENRVTQLIEHRNETWQNARDSFGHEQPAAPSQSDFVFHAISPAMDKITASPQQLHEFIEAAAHKVVERVEKTL